MTHGWNPLGNALLMYCTHSTNKFQLNSNAVPLTDKEVSVVMMKTVETEYRDEPFTKCYGHKMTSTVNYDVSVCRTLRLVQTMILTTFLINPTY